jgi:transposase-like protein
MPRRRCTPEEIIGKLREAEVPLSQGQSVGQVSRTLGISDQTHSRWRKEYGGLPAEHRGHVAHGAGTAAQGP